MRSIKELQKAIYENAKAKGFYEDPFNIPEKLALIHSEVSEALEDFRISKYPTVGWAEGWYEHSGVDKFETSEREEVSGKLNKPIGFASELADVVIRVLDLAGALDIDMQRAIEEKMAYNATRPHRHGNKKC